MQQLNSRGVELPENQRLLAQLVSLERRITRGGQEQIDSRGHEDLANATAGCTAMIARAATRRGMMVCDSYTGQVMSLAEYGAKYGT